MLSIFAMDVTGVRCRKRIAPRRNVAQYELTAFGSQTRESWSHSIDSTLLRYRNRTVSESAQFDGCLCNWQSGDRIGNNPLDRRILLWRSSRSGNPNKQNCSI